MVENCTMMLRTKKVLIIDDEPEFCEDIAFFLGGLYKITIAHGSREGMRLVKYIKPDLIILDIVMPANFTTDPENEGLEVLKKLKGGDQSKTPVIVLTKKNSKEVKKECLALGADGFFQKPPLLEKLVGEIEGIFSCDLF